MEKKSKWMYILPVMFGFFIMGFCDIVGISSDYAQKAFGWSPAMTGFIPSMVFIWFLFLGIPVGVWMNKWGRKNTVLFSMGVTVIGMVLPLIAYTAVTCMIAYAFLGIGNAILQVSLNPLLTNVVTDKKLLTSSLTAGQGFVFPGRTGDCFVGSALFRTWGHSIVVLLFSDIGRNYPFIRIVDDGYAYTPRENG